MISLFANNSQAFLEGFGWTLLSSVIALIGSLILGTIFALFQVIPNKVLNIIGRVYVEILRNIPLLVITMFFYVVVAKTFSLDGFSSGTIGLTLYTSAFIAETIRAGIEAIPEGQLEAGLSNGMTWGQTMRQVVYHKRLRWSFRH